MKYLLVLAMLVCAILTDAQTNSFPLYSNGNSTGGTGDMTNLVSPQLKMQSASSYPRIIHISAVSAVSAVYNFETGKHAYWGEPSDVGQYIFRGRDFLLSEGKMAVGTSTFSPNARLNISGGGIDVGGSTTTTDASLHIKTSYGSLDRLTQIHPSLANKPALNIMSSTDAAMNFSWWSWGVQNSGVWAIQPTTTFTGTTGFFIDRDGKVGIGVTAPSVKLDVFGNGGGTGSTSALRTRNGNSFDYFGNNQITLSFNGGVGYSHSIKTRHNSATPSGNAIDFYVWRPGDAVDATGSNLALTLDGGNVGIGTSSPGSPLTVVGSGQSVVNVTNLSDQDFQIKLSASSDLDKKTVIGPSTLNRFSLGVNLKESLTIINGGNVGIGTTSPNQKLTVNGTIYGKEIKVDLAVPGPDYVFEKNYALPSLKEVQLYIDQNKHLPEVPTAKEMEKNGINVSEMNMILLKKVEELTLYVLDQQKQIDTLKNIHNKK